jgi:outer membrane cobalamin receptor
MSTDNPQPTFFTLVDNASDLKLINVNQIVMVHGRRGDTIQIEMSSGATISLRGQEAIGGLIELLSKTAVTHFGQNLAETFAKNDETPSTGFQTSVK